MNNPSSALQIIDLASKSHLHPIVRADLIRIQTFLNLQTSRSESEKRILRKWIGSALGIYEKLGGQQGALIGKGLCYVGRAESQGKKGGKDLDKGIKCFLEAEFQAGLGYVHDLIERSYK